MDGIETTATETAPATGAETSGAAPTPVSELTDWSDWLAQSGSGAAEAASGSDTPAVQEPVATDQRGPVPYDRFEEVVRGRQQLEEQLGQLQPLGGWAETIQQIQAMGLTPETFRQQILGGPQEQQQPQSPDDRFADWLGQEGIDPSECTPAELLALRSAHRQEEAIQQYQQQAQQQRQAEQEQALRSSWTAEITTIAAKYPEFQNPILRDALINTYEGRHGVQPNGQQLQALAEELRGAIQQHSQAAVAQYAQQKQQDARVPVAAGGNAPPPVSQVNFHELDDEQQMELFRSYRRAAAGAG